MCEKLAGGQGKDLIPSYFVQEIKAEMFAALFQGWEAQVPKHVAYTARAPGFVILSNEAGCLALDLLKSLQILSLLWIPHCHFIL